MPIQKLTIQEFISLAKQCPIFDVRSPGEYAHAHIPGAYSLPLFTDAERALVGTAYKQQSRQQAIKIGLDYFGPNMRNMVEEAEKILSTKRAMYANTKNSNASNTLQPTANIALVHCWRGGMRSAGVAWLLDLYGFKVYTLAGGYKAYRKWVREQFEKPYNFKIIGGHTGSGKTPVIHQLKEKNKNVVDLEALANHKGSAFGNVGIQPTQEMFENLLAENLLKHKSVVFSKIENQVDTLLAFDSTTLEGLGEALFLEDESQRIGNLQIPMPMWQNMRNSPIYFLDIPFEERLTYITQEYGKLSKEQLVNATLRIQKRLGGLETKNAINFLLEDNFRECFSILLRYYDKWYQNGLNKRQNLATLLNKIPCLGVDAIVNTQKIIACQSATV
jgi:tRNA 2-selenouridine synthase